MDYDADITKNHYARINDYRGTKEYSDYCPGIGLERSHKHDELPSLLGARWEIDKDIFWHFLEILPPVRWEPVRHR